MYWFPANDQERKANEYEKLANDLRSKKSSIKNRMQYAKNSIKEYGKIKGGKNSTDNTKIPGKYFFDASDQTYDALNKIKNDISSKVSDITNAITTADSQRKHYIKLANKEKEKKRKEREKELDELGENVKKFFG